MSAGFELARRWNRPPGPVHFLVGIAQGDGPAADARQPHAGSLIDAAEASPIPALGPLKLHRQAQGAARAWASSRGEQVNPEHLLVALLDQGSPTSWRRCTPPTLMPMAPAARF